MIWTFRLTLGMVAMMWTFLSAQALHLPAHLGYGYYEMSKPGPFDDLEMTLTWRQVAPPPKGMGYYAMFMFYFENKKGGYTGLQWDKEGTKAIFSIWDDGPGGKIATPQGGCVRFGHEGSGASCIIPFAWKAGREYRLRVTRLERSELGVSWRGAVVDLLTGVETPIGVIRLGDDAQGYGGLSKKSTSVLEYYGRGDFACSDLPLTVVDWHGPFAQGGEVGSKKVRTWYPAPIPLKDKKTPESCTNIDVSSPSVDMVEHRAGGTTQRKTPHDTRIRWRIK